MTHEKVVAETKAHPLWVHFGAGNIFRGFVAAMLLERFNAGAAPLAVRNEKYFVAELAGPGAVRKTLHEALA